ncbi:glycoside hydrolase family 108 protein [Desulfobulbus oligotrophicus]|uniref:Glycoside hydrolase family 108 protein n=1 Tax=Desulfobulbus oligotrophicus TaxID=1909699 RepID=A0A7T6ARZ2_9BACT|nr:glycoside hydrolase family 108 protein [Desulfobulbus oligotrophicus]
MRLLRWCLILATIAAAWLLIKVYTEELVTNFDRAIVHVLANEGGYSNNPKDPGGETMWGITRATATAAGYSGEMKDLPLRIAKKIYRERYWRLEYERMPYVVAVQVFDAAVNSGPVAAIKWLQQAVGTRQDGVIGPLTMAAVGRRDPLQIVLRFCSARLKFLTSLPTWPSFGRGWVNRIVGNMLITDND